MSSRIGYRAALAAAFLLGALAVVPVCAAGELPVFSGDRAMEWLVRQCEIGPRTPGSAGNRELQGLIEATGREAGLTVRRHCFQLTEPWAGERVEACNLVVSTAGTGPRLWLGAHFDTRPGCDLDPDPERRAEPLTGANDGASGVAVLLHLVEILGQLPPEQGVDLIFFDAEDSGHSGSPSEFCLGSRKLAESLGGFASPLGADAPRGLILLDMVGEKDLRIGREGYSQRFAPAWTDYVFGRAAELGLPAFVDEPAASVYDDHVPFLGKGIPAVDLIDFDFPEWHTAGDVPEVCDPASLEQVGTLLVNLIYCP